MFTAEEAASIVKRLGLILYRMAMLFTALRKFENGEAANQVFAPMKISAPLCGWPKSTSTTVF
jgi:hypothetical protein